MTTIMDVIVHYATRLHVQIAEHGKLMTTTPGSQQLKRIPTTATGFNMW